MQIFVTNQNDFDHVDHFNGQEYVFPKGEKVLIPVEAAIHMFGFNQRDKTENLSRLGWANPKPGDEPDFGVKRLANFVFTQAVMIEQPIETLPPPEEGSDVVASA